MLFAAAADDIHFRGELPSYKRSFAACTNRRLPAPGGAPWFLTLSLNASNVTVTRSLRFSAKLLAGANTMLEYDPLVEMLYIAEKACESLGQIGKSAALRNLQMVLRFDRELSEGLQRRMAACLVVNSKQSEENKYL
jgi:hypothetical protein